MQQMDLVAELEARERALDALEQHRPALVAIAYETARRIAVEHGKVTSPEVLAALRAQGHGEAIDAVDRRFMGAVFRASRGWRRVGWVSTGSHRRPVAVWEIAANA